jgi:hypoxanthine phosphoribosyltransferase
LTQGLESRATAQRGTLALVRSDIREILFSRERIAQRVRELGAEIARDLETVNHNGKDEVMLVPILTGAIIFVADLMRELPFKMRIDVMTISSYPGRATTSQGARLVGELPDNFAGKHVIVVDDILDSGQTLRLVREQLEARKPKSLRTCVMLRKQNPTALAVPCEYVGFDIPDEFVVGYGLDFDHYYRNLPDIGTLKRDLM